MLTPSLLDRMKPVVDATIDSLAKTKFRIDPIGGPTYSTATSIVSAAYKRHGAILELAIRTRLSDSPHFVVWHEPEFKVSVPADHVVSGRNSDIANSLPIEMPYGEAGRTVQVDAFVYDTRINSLRAYEIKRGNGDFDAGKKRSILRDVLAVQALLRSYGSKLGRTSTVVESRVISYYGVRVLPDPLNIKGADMDDHFVFRVYDHVEAVNQYFQERLYALLERATGLTDAESASLCPQCPLHNRKQLSH